MSANNLVTRIIKSVFYVYFTFFFVYIKYIHCLGSSGLVVTRWPAARKSPGSNRAVVRSLCFDENHFDM